MSPERQVQYIYADCSRRISLLFAMIALLILAVAAVADSQFFPPPPFSAPAPFAPSFASPSFAAPPPPQPAFNSFAQPAPAFSSFPAAAPSFAQPKISIVQRNYQQDDRGQFTNSYTQTDGANFQETGELRPTNDRLDNVIVKKGSFRYTSPEGIPVEISYVADENGFRPVGSVIPVSVHSVAPSFK
ncbi:larval cuticle protein 1-like [Macrosteles quadrilineatus]|uniref:larval cuticle protein 1-like n=1 Tax=Macrosteles quadrilineatus TaxID=74068 RepID=UPI0023E108F1|nr:larval cuticle protein 1-like [Macrosteles quadrilineatus]